MSFSSTDHNRHNSLLPGYHSVNHHYHHHHHHHHHNISDNETSTCTS